MTDPTSASYFPPEEETRGDWLREETRAAFDRQCPDLSDTGESCAFTVHTGRHTWEVKPHPWCSEPLIEWTPSKLPGYAEAMAKLDRGESLFPKHEPGPARRPRTLASLEEERGRLLKRLAQVASDGPSDTAAGRLNAADIRTHYKRTDAELAAYAMASRRLEYIESRIRKLLNAAQPDTSTNGLNK